MNIPRFLECLDPTTDRVFVLHTQSPRIIAKVSDDGMSLEWVRGWGDAAGA